MSAILLAVKDAIAEVRWCWMGVPCIFCGKRKSKLWDQPRKLEILRNLERSRFRIFRLACLESETSMEHWGCSIRFWCCFSATRPTGDESVMSRTTYHPKKKWCNKSGWRTSSQRVASSMLLLLLIRQLDRYNTFVTSNSSINILELSISTAVYQVGR
jgi:hypothetical protein